MLKVKTLALVTSAFLIQSSLLYAATTVSFYAYNQHGSITSSTDANGSLTATALNQYNDYGVNQSIGNNNGQISIHYDPYQYSGEYTDNESGLQPLGNGYRYYDPSLMHFISPDSYPLLNLYAYGSGNPIENVDPTGHISMSWQAGIGMAAAGVSGIITGFFTEGLGDFVGVSIAEAIAGSATSAIGDAATDALGGKITAKQWGLDVGISAITGLIAPELGGAASSLNRSMSTGGITLDDIDSSVGTAWIKFRYRSSNINDLIESTDLSTAGDNSETLASKINPKKGKDNCGPCVAAYQASKNGKLYIAKDIGPMNIDQLAYIMKSASGTQLYPLSSSGSLSRDEMFSVLRRLSPKSEGVLMGEYGFFNGHFMYFEINKNADISIIDPQVGKVYPLNQISTGYRSFRYFTTVRR